MTGGSLRRLKPCLSFCDHSTRTQCRSYATKVLQGEALGPIHEDEHQSFRVRKDGTCLPIPPLLDPVILSERSRWEQTKAKPDVSKLTPFQKKLSENPYARILASPVRQSRAPQILLPSALLISLHPRPHPTTSDPWLLPVSLATSKKHLGPPFRFLGHAYIVSHLSAKKNWQKGLYARMSEKLGRPAAAKLVWREDMTDLVLSLLQKQVVGKLKWYFGERSQLIAVKSPGSEDIEGIDDVSCVLYLGSLKTPADAIQTQALQITEEAEHWVSYYTKTFARLLDPHKASNVTHSSPTWYTEPLVPRLQPRARYPSLEFKTTTWRGRKVAVYSLYDLLGEAKVAELVQGSRLEGERCLVIKRRRHNVPVEMLLMQLQAYVASPGP